MKYNGLRVRIFISCLLLGLVAAGVIWGIVWLRSNDTLPIKTVRVQGRFLHMSQAQTELQQVIAPYVRGNFFTVDVDAIKDALTEVPWLTRISVVRTWPDTLWIRVQERTPVAHWGHNALLDADGTLFYPGDYAFSSELPWLDGPPEHEAMVWQQYKDMGQALAPAGLTLERLTLSARGAWYAELNNGVALILGQSQVLERLTRFLSIYSDLPAARQSSIATVDLRYTNGMTVAWKKNEVKSSRDETKNAKQA